MSELQLLLVEDNDDDRFLTIRTLKKLSLPLQIEVAKNGDEALQRLLDEKNSAPNVVLLDLQLPKIGGIPLLARVRERFSSFELPVIILSSSDNPTDINLCRELGISGYLAKPLEPLVIAALLQSVSAR